MNDFIEYSTAFHDHNEEYLYHWGIKGMKWRRKNTRRDDEEEVRGTHTDVYEERKKQKFWNHYRKSKGNGGGHRG